MKNNTHSDKLGGPKAVLALSLFCHLSLAAVTATWDGGSAGNAAWSTAANWVLDSVPASGSSLDVSFYAAGAGNLVTNYLGTGAYTLRSLNFTADADSDVVTRLSSSPTGGSTRNLSFGGAGGAAITSDPGATGNFTLGVGNGSVVLLESLTISHSGTGLLLINRPITGTGFGITNNGNGTVMLSAINTFDGGVTLNNGTLSLGNNSALGTGAFTVNGGALNVTAGRTGANDNVQNWNGDFTFLGAYSLNLGLGTVTINADRQVTVEANTLTVGGGISDGGNRYRLTKAGYGALTLSATNTYSGGTTVKAGTLQFGVDNGLGTGGLSLNAGAKLASGATVVLTNDVAIDGAVEINTASGNLDAYGTIRGAGSIRKTGANQLVLRSENMFAGGLTNSTGIVTVKHANALGTGVYVVEGGTTYWDGKFDTANDGRGITNDIVLLASKNFNTLGASNRILLSGKISGPGGFNRNCFAGSKLTLTGDNTFESGVRLDIGELYLGHAHALGTGPVTNKVSSGFIGVTADLSGGTGVANPFVLTSNLVINITNNLQLSGSISRSADTEVAPLLIKRGASALILSGSNTYDGGTTVEEGTLRLACNEGADTQENPKRYHSV